MIPFLQNLIDAVSLGSIYALVALGIGLLFGILRLINFAHGDFITVGAYALIVPSADVTARLLIGGWPWPVMIPTICLIVIVAALLTDALVFRPLRRASSPSLMIASFAVSYIIQNGVLMAYGARPKAVDLWSGANSQILIGDLRVPMLQLVTLVVTLVLMGGLTLFLKKTPYGIQMRAAAEDFRMAQYLGVRGNLVIGLAFAISGCSPAWFRSSRPRNPARSATRWGCRSPCSPSWRWWSAAWGASSGRWSAASPSGSSSRCSRPTCRRTCGPSATPSPSPS